MMPSRHRGLRERSGDVRRAFIRICEISLDRLVAFRQHQGCRQAIAGVGSKCFQGRVLWHVLQAVVDRPAQVLLLQRNITRNYQRENIMSDSTRVIKPAAEELPTDVLDLIRVVAELPGELRDRVEPVLGRVIESTKRRRRIMNLVQDALAQLRLDMKYLLFDLEATRRERDGFKQQLEGNEDL